MVTVVVANMRVYRVFNGKIQQIHEKPTSDSAAVIVDENNKKLWIWKGTRSSPHSRYRASAFATKLKTQLKLVGAKTVFVEEGREPADYPLK